MYKYKIHKKILTHIYAYKNNKKQLSRRNLTKATIPRIK